MSTGTPQGGAAESQHHAADVLDEAHKESRFATLQRKWDGLPRWQQWIALLVVAAFLYCMPFLNPPLLKTTATDFPVACAEMARYALIALGLNVVVGQAGLLDLGYVGFFAVGSYVAALWTSPDSTLVHLPYLWSLPLAMVVTVFFGILLGIPTLRLRGDYLAIVTLGFGEIIRLLATLIPPLKGQQGFQNIGRPPGTDSAGKALFLNTNGTAWYMLTVTVIIVVMLLLGNLERSRVGRAWNAIREDEDAAEIMGVPTFKFKLYAFGIGAAIGGLTGAITAGQIGFVNNQGFNVQTSMLFLTAVILGGAGNRFGAVIGGVMVAYIPLRFTGIAEYKYLIFGVLLVIMMIFRPQGLFGARQHLLALGRTVNARVAAMRGAVPPATGTKETI
jgi:branched-chain amino acid transport system permease protein